MSDDMTLCPVCGEQMTFSHKNIVGQDVYMRSEDGKIEIGE